MLFQRHKQLKLKGPGEQDMRCWEECCKCSRLVVVVVVLLLLLSRASVGGCVRPISKGTRTSLGHLFNAQLPRGPVPPSGPSPCHEKLSPYNQRQFSYSHDFITLEEKIAVHNIELRV
ncbi:hypothetical protein GQ457_03G009710 [Hibiscus cannabinus]